MSLLCLLSDDCFGDLYYGRQLIAKLTALFYDNCLASDCFVTYGPVSMKLINVFKIGGTDPP